MSQPLTYAFEAYRRLHNIAIYMKGCQGAGCIQGAAQEQQQSTRNRTADG